MKTYIAAVWYASSVAMNVDGWKALQRRVIKREAESPQQFEGIVRDELGSCTDVDMTIEFGVIGEPWGKK